MQEKRLYRSETNRMICGVCGGIAEYFGVDPTLIRLAFVLFLFGAASGLFAYVGAAVLIPNQSQVM